MLGFSAPKISSVEEGMNYDNVGKVGFSKVSKPLLEILEGGDYTVDLDQIDYRRFIHIRADHIEKKFVDGEMVRTDTYYDLYRCKEEDFQGNDYYK
jgi:hypothetical protein